MLRGDGTGGSDMFATYSGEFDDYRQQISHAIEDYGVADASKRGTLSRKIVQDIDELGDIIKQMELEVRSHQGPARQTLNEQLVDFRKSRQEIQKAWRIAKEKADAGNRDKLLSGARSAGAGEGVYAQTNTRCGHNHRAVVRTPRQEVEVSRLTGLVVFTRICPSVAEKVRWTACLPRRTSGCPRRAAHSLIQSV